MGKKNKGNASAKKSRKGISIRIKLIFSILVPVIFIVILGFTSYLKAKNALVENYESQTESMVNVIGEYYDLVIDSVSSTSNDIVHNSTVKDYFAGEYSGDVFNEKTIETDLKSTLKSTKEGNKYISNIQIIPSDHGSLIYTDVKGDKEAYQDIASLNILTNSDTDYVWLGDRGDLDTVLLTDKTNYSLSIIRPVINIYYSITAYAVFDVDYNALKELLTNTELCEGSVVALITPDGRELSSKVSKADTVEASSETDKYLSGQSFINTGNDQGTTYVTYDNENYLMVYKSLNNEGFKVFVLVPESQMLEDANSIFLTTVILVLASCLVAIVIGTLIAKGFSNAIKVMMKGLDKAAKGDLTVDVTTKRKDEFLTLSRSINNTLKNVRDLLIKANSVTEVVDAASEEVASNAEIMLQSVEEIKDSITEIDSGIVNQAEEAQKCLNQMDSLSTQIEEVSKNAESISNISNETRRIVTDGLTTIDELKEKSNDTKEATESVIKCIEELNESSSSIEEIVGVINQIAGRTSLLSLNASIEAARAGVYGQGFNVVAAEIRKLAEQSMDSVHKIQAIVGNIRTQTEETVKVARKSADIVNSQDETLTKTVNVFTEIDQTVGSLTSDLDSILTEINTIEDAKKETLSAIESISAISQETAAVTNSVQNSAQSQLEAAETLASAAKALRVDSEDLSTAIHIFSI